MTRPYVAITNRPWRLSIGGVIADATTGRQLDGATVQLEPPPGGAFARWLAIYRLQYPQTWDELLERPDRTQSRADGSFRFLDLSPDATPYVVSAALPHYLSASQPATIVAGAAYCMLRFDLQVDMGN